MTKINYTPTFVRVGTCLSQVVFLLSCLGILSPIFAKGTQIPQNNPPKVVGYFASWAAAGAENNIQYDKFTHLIYSFGIPNTNGRLKPIEQAPRLQTLINKARAKNVKVLLAIGGYSDNGEELDPRFEAIAANPTLRKILVDDIIAAVNQYGLDGIDMDWEVPDQGASYTNFLNLMSELSAHLKPNGKLLTAAVSAGAGWGYYDIQLNPYVDFLNIMAYDGDAGVGHSPYSFAVSAINLWVNTRGFAANKIILGVPFYARPSWSAYSTLLARGADPYKDQFNTDYYNGITTIQAKVALAQARNLGGVMIWEISQDAIGQYSLVTAIANALTPACTSNCPPTISLDLPTSVETGKPFTLSANANDPDGGTVTVAYSVNGTAIGSSNTSPFNIIWTPSTNGTYTIRATVTDDENQTATAQSTIIATTCTLPSWNAATAYVGGSKVSYNGKAYTAKWWTQNDRPDISVVWLLNGNCGGQTPVNQAPTVNITAPSNNATFNSLAAINITANATDADGSISKVDFYIGNTLISSDNTAPYTATWTPTANGTYTFTAKATDNAGASTTSTAVTVVVATGVVVTTGVTISYQVTTNWGTGYNANLTIKNNGTTPINGWNLVLNMAGQVTSLWNAQNYSQTGGTLNVSANSSFWNGVIAPNASATIGMGVSYTGVLTLPTTANFNGTTVTINHLGGGRLENFAANDVFIYPNPTTHQTVVKLTVQEKTTAKICLYNILGEKVLQIPAEQFRQGTNEIMLDIANLQNGLYLMYVEADQKTSTYKLIKQ